jgi:hydrogenase maturation protease
MQRLIVGIGSFQGDDQVGWSIVERLKHRGNFVANFKLIAKPLDLLDILDTCVELILIDAASGFDNDEIKFWKWPTTDLLSSISRGTHGYGLVEALRLAEELQLLPSDVTIIGIPVKTCGALQPISSQDLASMEKIVEKLEAVYA